MAIEDFEDASRILRPGVYALTLAGRVVFVGRAKLLLAMIYAHKATTRGKSSPFPVAPIAFDGVEIFPCRLDQLDQVYAETLRITGWAEPRKRA